MYPPANQKNSFSRGITRLARCGGIDFFIALASRHIASCQHQTEIPPFPKNRFKCIPTPLPVAPGENRQTVAKYPQLTLWRATPLLLLSTGVHVFCAVLTVLNPAIWQWTLGAVIANHLLILATIVMWPRSRLLGPNMARLPAAAALRGEVALTFDDGPDPLVTPHVLDLLDQYGAKASFFCVAEKVIAHPELARENHQARTQRGKPHELPSSCICLFRAGCHAA